MNAKNAPKVLFEFVIYKPKLTLYRAVQAADGTFRMDKRGAVAHKYRTALWCGSEAALIQFRQAVESQFKKIDWHPQQGGESCRA